MRFSFLQKQTALKVTLLLAASLTVMSGATIAPSLPTMKEYFREVPQVALLTKLVLTIPALLIAITAPLVGGLVNRLGRLRLLYISLLLYALAGSTGLWMDNLYSILVGRALLGVSVGGIMTVISTLVGDYFTGEARDKFSGLQSLFMAAGGVVVVGVGGLLTDINWRYPFALYLFSLIVIGLVAISLYEPQLEEQTSSTTPTQPLPAKTISLVLLTLFVAMAIFYLTPVQIPFLLEKRGIITASLSGLAISFSTIGGAISAYFYARLKKKFSFYYLFAFTFGALAIGYGLVGSFSAYSITLLGLFISGTGVGILMPNGTIWLLSITPLKKRALVMGLFTSALFLGQFFSPIIVQPVDTAVGLPNTFLITGGLAAVSAIIYGLLGKYNLLKTSSKEASV